MLVSVDTGNDIAEFLTSRRARITPEQAGLPTWGPLAVAVFGDSPGADHAFLPTGPASSCSRSPNQFGTG
jgi:hypothetical protein